MSAEATAFRDLITAGGFRRALTVQGFAEPQFSEGYGPRFPFFWWGRVPKVVSDVAQQGYVDVEREMATAMAPA